MPTIASLDPASLPPLWSTVTASLPPVGSTVAAVRRSHVDAMAEVFTPEVAPLWNALLAGAEPYTVLQANGLLITATYAELWAVMRELSDVLSAIEDRDRMASRVGSIMALLSVSARWPRWSPRPEVWWNHSFAPSIRQATRRNAYWRRVAVDDAVRWAVADRMVAAVAASPRWLRWSTQAVWRLSGIESVPPTYLAILPPGAAMFGPVRPGVLPPSTLSIGAPETTDALRAFFSEVPNLTEVALLASSGWRVASEAMSWCLWLATESLCPFDAAPLDRVVRHHRVQEVFAAWWLDEVRAHGPVD